MANKIKVLAVGVISVLALSACTMKQNVIEQKPRLVCDDCSGLVYYGTPAPAPENPMVSIAKVAASAGATIAGYGFLADAAKSITSTTANAGKVEVVESLTESVEVVEVEPFIVEPVIVEP